MTPLAQAISLALVEFIWQGLLVLIFVLAIVFFLRQRSPHVRYLVYCAGLFALAALPVITGVALYDPLPGVNARPAAITLTIRAVWNGAMSSSAATKWLAAFQPWVLRIWFAGVIFLSLRLALLGTRISALRRSGIPADQRIRRAAADVASRMDMTRVIRVLVSVIPDGPSVAGWFRPVILLPAATILNLTPEQLEAILAHEIAHLRRYDDVVNIAQSVIETILFYHPAVWWMSNRIRRERELCCDDLAVQACGDALCYARALTALERLRLASTRLALGAMGIADTPLEYRIRRIIGAPVRDYAPSTLPGILAFALVLACAAIYSVPANSAVPPGVPVEYPEAARISGIQGTVPVKVTVDAAGRVSEAEAIGGPRELRRAAVRSASAVEFAPGPAGSTKQVDVAFQLAGPSASQTTTGTAAPASSSPGVTGPTRPPLRWVDQGEYEIGIAADREKDPAKKLDLLKKWKQQYPNSDLGNQRTLMTAQALISVLAAGYGKPASETDALEAAQKAAQELVDHFEEYFNDTVKPWNVTNDQWAEARKACELQVHSVFAYIAQTERDDKTAEAEFKRVLAIEPEQASASYGLAGAIIRQMATNGDVSRYSEAIYEFARAVAVRGPNALGIEARSMAEIALRKYYVSYYGSDEGLIGLIVETSSSALPPAGFHIVNLAENEPIRKAHAAWAAANPDLDRWEETKVALLERGDTYFGELRDSGLKTFRATVVSQISANRILVNVDGVAAGDAVLKFDGDQVGAVRPGTAIQFTGAVDSYTPDPFVVTFVIRDPKNDIAGLSNGGAKHGNFLSRVVKSLFHAVRHLG